MRISDWSSDVCSSDLKGWIALFLFIMLALIAMIAKIAFYFYYDQFVKRRIDPIDYLRMEQSATLKLSKTLYKMCNTGNTRSDSWRPASNAFEKVETYLSDSGRHLVIKNRDLESASGEIRVDLEQIPIPANIRMDSDSTDSSATSNQPGNLREIMMIVQRHRRSQRNG